MVDEIDDVDDEVLDAWSDDDETSETLKAPFPWFGGKSRAAHLVWPRFGDVPNYVEPFAGSLAIPLARPHPPRIETVNDLCAYIANFWRALQADPDGVASHADWPVNEIDLHARHRWLVETAFERVEALRNDPDLYDVRVAGEWVWGQCLWIGSGWCARPEWTGRVNVGSSRGKHTDEYLNRPDLSSANGRGMLSKKSSRMGDVTSQRRRPQLSNDNGIIAHGGKKRPYVGGHGGGVGVHRPSLIGEDPSSQQKKPYLDRGGRGVQSDTVLDDQGQHRWQKRPDIARRGAKGVINNPAGGLRRFQLGGQGGGSGVHAPRLTKQQVPDLSGSRGAAGRGIHASGFELRSGGLFDYMHALATRLRRVRVCCGDWTRVVTPAVTTYIGLTAVFLDPPYSQAERAICYAQDHDVAPAVRAWALENGENRQLRIALCGYEGEHDMPSTWSKVAWKAGGGYGRSVRGKANRHRERIWFSPHCLPPSDMPLFDQHQEASQ